MEKIKDDRGPAGSPDFMSRLADVDRRDFMALACMRPVRKGDLIFQNGDPANHIYVVEAGRVKIYQLSPAGKEVLFWFCFPGEIFGMAEVFYGGDRRVYAEAGEASRILSIRREDLQGFIQTRPQVALLVIDIFARRLRDMGDMVQRLVSNDVTERLIILLTRLSQRYGSRVGNKVYLDIPITHQEMADMIGATRQSVTTALSMLKRVGALTSRNRRLCITSQAILEGVSSRPPPSATNNVDSED